MKAAPLATGAPVAVFEADAQGRLIYANRYWEELVGLTIEEILGEGMYELKKAHSGRVAVKMNSREAIEEAIRKAKGE